MKKVGALHTNLTFMDFHKNWALGVVFPAECNALICFVIDIAIKWRSTEGRPAEKMAYFARKSEEIHYFSKSGLCNVLSYFKLTEIVIIGKYRSFRCELIFIWFKLINFLNLMKNGCTFIKNLSLTGSDPLDPKSDFPP